MSPMNTNKHTKYTRFPRVSGDEPVAGPRDPRGGVFSPRERG